MTPSSRRNFNCSWDQCGKPFKRKSDLCRHYRIHTNERPYHCTITDCNKSFIQRSALAIHLRTHTGEKPHACGHEECQKAFSDSSSLARHRRIHTGNRPYTCREPTCGRSFCRKTTLTKHQHLSHPPESLTRSSEDATLMSIPNGQYMLAQQPSHPQSAPPSHEFYSPQSVQMRSVPVHETTPATLPQNVPVPVASPVHTSHAQHSQHHPHPFPLSQPQQQHEHQQQQRQQCMQMVQQHYGQISYVDYIPAAYGQATFQAQRIALDQSMVVSYHPDYAYKF